MRAFAWIAFGGSIALVLLAAFPWGDFVAHSHWARVRWVPFLSPPANPVDMLGNLLLCMPLGASVAHLARKRPLLASGAVALALSFFVEAAQVYSHRRFPSTTDLICNVAGSVIAAAVITRARA